MKLNSDNSKAPRQLLALLITFALAVCIGALILYPSKSLPVLHPADLNPALVDARDWNRAQHSITPFDLINHHGEDIHLDDVLGQVLIVDFFFTRARRSARS